MIRPFDVEVSVTDRKTGKASSVVRREHAWDPVQAVQQAILNCAAFLGPAGETHDVRLVRVSPPAEMVEAAAAESAEIVRSVLERIRTKP